MPAGHGHHGRGTGRESLLPTAVNFLYLLTGTREPPLRRSSVASSSSRRVHRLLMVGAQQLTFAWRTACLAISCWDSHADSAFNLCSPGGCLTWPGLGVLIRGMGATAQPASLGRRGDNEMVPGAPGIMSSPESAPSGV